MFTVTTTPERLHLRAGPGTHFDSLGLLAQGHALNVSAIDSSGTWLQVRSDPADGQAGWCSARYLLPAGASPWLAVAVKEIGVKEYPGANIHHPRIQLYLSCVNGLGRIDQQQDETPWCSCFMNWCVEQCGVMGTDSAWAQSWGNWRSAVPLDQGRSGDIAVFERSSASVAGGHVGLLICANAQQGRVLVLGGNQANAVRYAWFPIDGERLGTHYRLLSVRQPKA